MYKILPETVYVQIYNTGKFNFNAFRWIFIAAEVVNK